MRAALTPSTLLRPHLGRFVAGLVCLAVLAVAGAAYAYLTGPLLQVVLTGGARGTHAFVGLLPPIGPLSPVGDPGAALIAVAAVLVLVAAVKGAAQLGQAILLDGTAERVGHDLRQRVYGHLLRMPLGAHRRYGRGDLMVRLIDDLRRVQQCTVAAAIGLVRDGLAAVALVVVAFVLDARLTLIALAVLPCVGLVVARLARRVRRAASRGQDALGAMGQRADQGLAALREVKSCGAEQRELDVFGGHSWAATRWALSRIRARASAPLFNEVAAAVGVGAALVAAGHLVASGRIDPVRLISLITAVLLLYRPIKGIGNALQTMAAGRASVARVAELLVQPAERAGDGGSLPPLSGSVRADEVGYRYAGGFALGGVDLSLSIGRVLAVAGPSGAGKTTLANLLCGLERPTEGRVLWDGRDLSAWPLSALRAQVALVPQLPLIFDGTIADNLRYGAPGASDAELAEAIDAAVLGDWVASLPSGIATVIGPDGQQLSVGQAQRLAVARALLRPASLLVLDEPASALDPEAERRLIVTLRRAARSRAVLLIAHSERLLALADQVLILRDGVPQRQQDWPPRTLRATM